MVGAEDEVDVGAAAAAAADDDDVGAHADDDDPSPLYISDAFFSCVQLMIHTSCTNALIDIICT